MINSKVFLRCTAVHNSGKLSTNSSSTCYLDMHFLRRTCFCKLIISNCKHICHIKCQYTFYFLKFIFKVIAKLSQAPAPAQLAQLSLISLNPAIVDFPLRGGGTHFFLLQFLGGETFLTLDPGLKGVSNLSSSVERPYDKCQRTHIIQNLFHDTYIIFPFSIFSPIRILFLSTDDHSQFLELCLFTKYRQLSGQIVCI